VVSDWRRGCSSELLAEAPAALGAVGENADTSVVVTYRPTHSWVVYPIALLALAVVFEAFAGVESHVHGAGEWCIAILVTAAGVAAPLGLMLWNRCVGVRVSAAGIVSIGPDSADVIEWRDLSRFFVDDRGPNRIGVYAGLADGSRVALYALRGPRRDRRRLEEICEVLSTKLRHEQSLGEAPSAPPTFAGVPYGWRRRIHGGHTRVRAV